MRILLTSFMLLFVAPLAQAKFSYEGYLVDNAGLPVVSTPIVVQLKLSTVNGACLIYEETHSGVTTDAEGYFSVVVGAGTVGTTHTALSFDDLFMNGSTINATNPSCTANPAAGEERVLNVLVNVNGGGYENFGSLAVYPAQNSQSSLKIGKHTESSLLRVETAGVPSALSPLTPANVTELTALLGGTSNLYMKNSGSGAAALPVVSTAGSSGMTNSGDMWFNSTTNQLQYYNGSSVVSVAAGGGTVTNVTGTAPISVNNGSSTPGISISQAGVSSDGFLSSTHWNSFNNTASVVSSATDAPTVNALMKRNASGNFSANSGIFSNTVQIKGGTSGIVSLQAPTVFGDYTLTLPGDTGTNGQVLTSNGSGLLSWTSPGAGSVLVGGNSEGMPLSLGTNDANSFSLRTNGTDKLNITPAGNVGIGTNSPISLLTVGSSAGNSKVAQFEGAVDARINNATPLKALSLVNLNGTLGSGTVLDFSTINNSSTLKTSGEISSFLTVNTSGAEDGVVAISTITGGSVSEKMRIDSSGKLSVTGSVQIGVDAGTCDGTRDGALRRNGGALEYCNGTAWKGLSEPHGTVVFSTAGPTTWTVPASVTRVKVSLIGGGGGGDNSMYGGQPGGASYGWMPVTPGTNMNVTVGAGGAVNTNGGFSKFDDGSNFIRADGGYFGNNMTAPTLTFSGAGVSTVPAPGLPQLLGAGKGGQSSTSTGASGLVLIEW